MYFRQIIALTLVFLTTPSYSMPLTPWGPFGLLRDIASALPNEAKEQIGRSLPEFTRHVPLVGEVVEEYTNDSPKRRLKSWYRRMIGTSGVLGVQLSPAKEVVAAIGLAIGISYDNASNFNAWVDNLTDEEAENRYAMIATVRNLANFF